MVAHMLLIDCGGPRKHRNSVGLDPKGMMAKVQVPEELKKADASNHIIMSAWTGKDIVVESFGLRSWDVLNGAMLNM